MDTENNEDQDREKILLEDQNEEGATDDEDDEDLPFILQPGEEIVDEAGDIEYRGMVITSFGSYVGGNIDSLFGGFTTSKIRKQEAGILDAKKVFLHLTNLRLVFSGPYVDDPVISEIPLSAIIGVTPADWTFLGATLGGKIMLSVKVPAGDVEKIGLSFHGRKDGAEKKSDSFARRDEWLKIINNQIRAFKIIQNTQQKSLDADDPVNVAKLRLARGEITPQEFKEILDLLKET